MKRLPLVLILVLTTAAAFTFMHHGARTDERTGRYLAALAADEPPGALPAPKERTDWEAARVFYHRKLIEALGLDLLPDRALNQRTAGEQAFDTYRVSRLVFDSLPEIHGIADLYLPVNGAGPFPATLFIASTDDGANDVAVLRTAATLAAAGIATLVLEPPGCGDRRITGRGDPALFLSGLTPAGVAVWETRRLIEMLRHRPDIDPRRIAVAGAGDGGMTALYTAALDDSVAAGAAILSVGGFGAQMTATEDPDTNGLIIFSRRDLEQHHILALVAPRPFLVIAGKKDTERTAAATETVRRARDIYRFLGADERLEFTVASGSRRYQPPHRQLLYDLLTRSLGGLATGEEEDPDRALFPAPFDPAQEITLAELARRNALLLRDTLRQHRDEIGPVAYAAELAEALRDLSGAGLFPPPVGPAAVIPAGPVESTAAVIVVRGKHSRALIAALTEARITTREIDLHTGPGTLFPLPLRDDPVHRTAAHALTIGVPLALHWSGDIRAAAEELVKSGLTTVGLYAEGSDAGLAALLAAHRTDAIGWIALRDMTASIVPGIGDPAAIERLALQAPRLLQVADIGDLIAALAPRRIFLTGVRGPDGEPLEPAALRRLIWETRHLVMENGPADEILLRFLTTRGTTPTP